MRPFETSLTCDLIDASLEAAARKGSPAHQYLPERERRPPLEALVLGFEGVLYDGGQWQRWLVQVLSRMGLHTSYLPLQRVWEYDYLDAVVEGRLEFWDAWRQFLRGCGLARLQVAEIEAAARARKQQCDQDLRPFAGVHKALAELTRRQIPLVLLDYSGRSQQQVLDLLAAMQLDEFLPLVVVWPGAVKSNCPRVRFAASLDLLPPGTNAVGYVGCDTRQLQWAADTGLWTVAFNQDYDAAAHQFLDHFENLLDLVVIANSPRSSLSQA